jgi:hypothetical protein
MNILGSDYDSVSLASRLRWEAQPTAIVSGSEMWCRTSRRQIAELRDDEGHKLPLRDVLWVVLYPPREDRIWRAQAEGVPSEIVGRGKSSDEAVHDWRKRLRATTMRYLEMRPFEMSEEDRELWNKLQSMIDISRYRETKPLVVRQLGKIVKLRERVTVVRWEDGVREQVDRSLFDELFSRFRIGQSFEAIVTRHPKTFRIMRADAVRRLTRPPVSAEESAALWNCVVGDRAAEDSKVTAKADEKFWLQPE